MLSFWDLLMSIGLIAWGLSALYNNKLMYWDLRVPTWCSYLLIAFGIGYLLIKLKCAQHDSTVICPRCKTAFNNRRMSRCPHCDVDLEPLEGFYDRHPELKDE